MDLYKEITERIITQMENGIIPWHSRGYQEKPSVAQQASLTAC